MVAWMIEAIQVFIISLGTSDVCDGWPGLYSYAATQIAHVLVGVVFGMLCFPIRVLLITGWIAKELFFDLSGCGWLWFVALDSIADLVFAGAGVALVLSLKREGGVGTFLKAGRGSFR